MEPIVHAARRLLIALACLAGCQAGAANRAAAEPTTHPATGPTTQPIAEAAERRSTLIDDNWRFLRADLFEAHEATFDDSKWQRVTLPHTWNLADGSDGGNNYYRGPAWYRRPLEVKDADLKANKRFYLRFGAASLVADVYVNGTKIGQHRGGFAAFCFDATEQLHAGNNEISVRVDNSRQPDIAPQSGDFTVFGGLYRDVELLVLHSLHISPMDDASSGIYLKPANVSANSATVEVTAKLRNAGDAIAGATLDVSIFDASSKGNFARASGKASINLAAKAEGDAKTTLALERPHLWNGVADPHLYYAEAILHDAAGQEMDRVFQTIGFRTISVDSDKGLILNGKPYAAHGVNIHQEVGGKGWAGSADDYAKCYQLVRDVGATVVRMAHYQHNPAEYSLCDSNGLIVWTEEPLVNEFGKASPAFADNLKQQLRELIKQNYNHPSVCFWSLWNEVGAKDDDADWQLVRECNALAHELDPSRITVAASNQDARRAQTNIPDIIAFNHYAGWYNGKADEWPHTLDNYRAATPGRAIGISEYGAGGSVNQHELNPARVDAGGAWHPEEYQCEVHERAYRAMKERPWLWGTFVWVMFDFSADQRNEGDHAGRNDKGLVTFDRKTPKDVYYFYQANWTTTPMVHITSAAYDPYPIGKSAVKVYSSCDKVELFLNGVSQGEQKGTDGIFLWPDVSFVEGKAVTIARGVKDGKTVEETVTRTVSKDASTRTTPAKVASTKAAGTKPATSSVK